MKFKENLIEIMKSGVAVNCDTEEKAKMLLEEEQEDDNDNYDNLAIKTNDIIHGLIDYADQNCESTIHTAETYRDGYIKGCEDSLSEVRAILLELNNN